jgi:hypothetical protein
MKTNSKGEDKEQSFNLLMRASVHHDLVQSKGSLR